MATTHANSRLSISGLGWGFSATLVVLDGGALVVVDASRSKAAESQPSPRLGGFGDPRLTAQGAIGCCVVQAYVAVVDREKKKERGAFPFAF